LHAQFTQINEINWLGITYSEVLSMY